MTTCSSAGCESRSSVARLPANSSLPRPTAVSSPAAASLLATVADTDSPAISAAVSAASQSPSMNWVMTWATRRSSP